MTLFQALVIFLSGMLTAGLSLQILCMAKMSQLRDEAARELHSTQPE